MSCKHLLTFRIATFSHRALGCSLCHRVLGCSLCGNHVLLLQAGVHYIEGRATVKDEHTVHINGKDYTVSLSDIPQCHLSSANGLISLMAMPTLLHTILARAPWLHNFATVVDSCSGTLTLVTASGPEFAHKD